MVLPVAWVERPGGAGVIPGDLPLPGVPGQGRVVTGSGAPPHRRRPVWPFHLAGKELVMDLSQPAQPAPLPPSAAPMRPRNGLGVAALVIGVASVVAGVSFVLFPLA